MHGLDPMIARYLATTFKTGEQTNYFNRDANGKPKPPDQGRWRCC